MRIKILRISVKQYTEKDYNGVDETVLQSRCTIEDSKTKENGAYRAGMQR